MSLPFDPAMLPPDLGLGGGPIPGMMGPPVSGPALPGPMPGLGGPGPLGPPMAPPMMDPMMGPMPAPPPMPMPGMPMPPPPGPVGPFGDMLGQQMPNPTMMFLASIMQQELEEDQGNAPADSKPKKPKR